MSGEILEAAKFAVTGTIVGATVGLLADMAHVQIMRALAPNGSTTNGSAIGRSVFVIVASGTLAAGFIYAGDRVMDTVMTGQTDPLYRLFYYQVAFHTMGASFAGASATRNLLGRAINGFTGPARPQRPAAKAAAAEAEDCLSCQK